HVVQRAPGRLPAPPQPHPRARALPRWRLGPPRRRPAARGDGREDRGRPHRPRRRPGMRRPPHPRFRFRPRRPPLVTAIRIATAAGATVIPGRPLPPGWVGKVWALHQGLEAATGEWVVTFDADTEPAQGAAAAVVRAALDRGDDFVSVGPTFRCETAPLRLLHP